MSASALRTAVASIPAACYERPLWRGLAYFARDAVIYVAAMLALTSTDHPPALVPLWLLTGLAISALFVIGHDAAHGALFGRPRLDTLVAHVAFLPSLHALAAWRLGHNRVHHGHTGRRYIDFVWHPLAPDEYAALPGPLRLRHRIEWSAWGAGLYYLRAVWWARMIRLVPASRFRRDLRRDRVRVVAIATLASAAVFAYGAARYGTILGATWMWLKVLLVPWLIFNWIIGVTVYVHHIGPDVAWEAGPKWTPVRGQVDGTACWRLPFWLNFFWHNVYVHTPHHVDPRIPFYHLPGAADALRSVLGDGVRPRRLRFADYVAITRRCKLFDFDRGAWVGYG